MSFTVTPRLTKTIHNYSAVVFAVISLIHLISIIFNIKLSTNQQWKFTHHCNLISVIKPCNHQYSIIIKDLIFYLLFTFDNFH